MRKRKKYSLEEKTAWVRRIVSNEISMGHASKVSGIHKSVLQAWKRLYETEGVKGLIRQSQNQNYPTLLKRTAVEDYLAGNVSLPELCKKYKIRSHAQLLIWIKRYNSGKDFGRKMSGGSRMKKARKTSQEERIQIVKACMERGSTPGYKNIRNWEKLAWKTAGGYGRLPKRPGQRLKNFVLR